MHLPPLNPVVYLATALVSLGILVLVMLLKRHGDRGRW
jgi:hypothetical protein